MSAQAPDLAATAKITVVCGSSGSGKSSFVKRKIETAPRVSVYDTDAEYCLLPGFKRIEKIAELVRYFTRARAGRFAFVPRRPGDAALFDLWAAATFAWGTCVAVAEETADVTSPGKAPPGWGMLVRRGRKRGIEIYAVTQRPSESDKTVIGNASTLHCGALARFQDRTYMARELDVPEPQIAQLRPLQWLERDRRTGALSAGVL